MFTDLQKAIPMLWKDYSVDTIRNALIRHWAQVNKITIDMLHQGTITAMFIGNSTPKEYITLLRHLRNLVPDLGLKDLEGAFEGFKDRKKKQTQGAD